MKDNEQPEADRRDASSGNDGDACAAVDTTARFYTVAGVKALETKHSLDRWLVSDDVYFRF